MRSDHLACGHCGGVVAEGNCPVCRITRAQLQRMGFAIPTPVIILIVALLTLMVAYVANHAV